MVAPVGLHGRTVGGVLAVDDEALVCKLRLGNNHGVVGCVQ
jgi:hypothetical protein